MNPCDLSECVSDEQAHLVHSECYANLVKRKRPVAPISSTRLMPTPFPPHLIDSEGEKCYSACKKVFPIDSKPSISKAFAQHVR